MHSTSGPDGASATLLPAGAILFSGRRFADERGWSREIFDLQALPDENAFPLAVENLVQTQVAGTLRGLHYQLAPFAQAKLVSMISGAAQFFWIDLSTVERPAPVHSVVLAADASSLYCPEGCAHGFLALKDDTVFTLRMSRPLSFEHRREISFFANDIGVSFKCPPRQELLSDRDRNAPTFEQRQFWH